MNQWRISRIKIANGRRMEGLGLMEWFLDLVAALSWLVRKEAMIHARRKESKRRLGTEIGTKQKSEHRDVKRTQRGDGILPHTVLCWLKRLKSTPRSPTVWHTTFSSTWWRSCGEGKRRDDGVCESCGPVRGESQRMEKEKDERRGGRVARGWKRSEWDECEGFKYKDTEACAVLSYWSRHSNDSLFSGDVGMHYSRGTKRETLTRERRKGVVPHGIPCHPTMGECGPYGSERERWREERERERESGTDRRKREHVSERIGIGWRETKGIGGGGLHRALAPKRAEAAIPRGAAAKWESVQRWSPARAHLTFLWQKIRTETLEDIGETVEHPR